MAAAHGMSSTGAQLPQLLGSKSGDVESKLLHDLDNEHGVEVQNERGDGPWIAYGDTRLSDPRNAKSRTLALEAVALSKQDIADALAQGQRYPEPTAKTTFAATRLVPRPVDASQDRWTGRTPTYQVETTSGIAVRQADDYTRTRDHLVASEGPGLIAGYFTDDDQVRAWVMAQPIEALAKQPTPEKERMIEALWSGWVAEEDMQAIERILQGVSSAAEMAKLRRKFEPRAIELNNFGQRARLRAALWRL